MLIRSLLNVNFVDHIMIKYFSLCFFALFIGFGPLKAQVVDSLQSIKTDTSQRRPKLKDQGKLKLYAFIPATVAVTYGFVAINSSSLRKLDDNIHNSIKHDNRNFYTSVDDYLRYAPVAVVYGLDLFGIKGKNNFRDKTSVLVIAGVFTTVSVGVLKASSNRMRPNRLNDYSFPSGHAATAFATAEFLRQEYGETSAWYTAAGYGMATATSVLRLYKSYHWFSDVVAGAGLGILSTKFAYLVYPSVKRAVFGKKNTNTVMMPAFQNGKPGIVFSARF